MTRAIVDQLIGQQRRAPSTYMTLISLRSAHLLRFASKGLCAALGLWELQKKRDSATHKRRANNREGERRTVFRKKVVEIRMVQLQKRAFEPMVKQLEARLRRQIKGQRIPVASVVLGTSHHLRPPLLRTRSSLGRVGRCSRPSTAFPTLSAPVKPPASIVRHRPGKT